MVKSELYAGLGLHVSTLTLEILETVIENRLNTKKSYFGVIKKLFSKLENSANCQNIY